jgi:hypothetical protein
MFSFLRMYIFMYLHPTPSQFFLTIMRLIFHHLFTYFCSSREHKYTHAFLYMNITFILYGKMYHIILQKQNFFFKKRKIIRLNELYTSVFQLIELICYFVVDVVTVDDTWCLFMDEHICFVVRGVVKSLNRDFLINVAFLIVTPFTFIISVSYHFHWINIHIFEMDIETSKQ